MERCFRSHLSVLMDACSENARGVNVNPTNKEKDNAEPVASMPGM